MRNAHLKALWRPIVLLLFLLPALLPLLRIDRIPCTHDGPFHIYRLVVVRDLLRHGALFTRWVPQLALGYGYPFFIYREPLPYLVGGALYALGIPVTLVVGLLYAAAALSAAWGAFTVARDWVGEPGAWIAALAYALGPYLLLDSLRRGNLPESVALGLVPWCLVAFRRLIERGRLRDFLVCTGLLVGLFLTHNITSLLLAPFLGGYVVLLAWQHRRERGWPWAFAAVILAVLLTAWFWLPALAEQGYVQLHLSRTTRNNDFHYNFVGWRELLFTLPAAYDSDYLNPPMRIALGAAQWVLGLGGLVVGIVTSRRWSERVMLIYFAGMALVTIWMGTPAALGLWEKVPALAFVQFPWRMVGRALLPLSLLSAWVIPPGWVRSPRRSALLAGAALLAVIVLSWPDTYPPKGTCSAEAYPDLSDVYAYEEQGWMGIDPESSYFPIWVETHPTDTALSEAFAGGNAPDRLDAASLPQVAEVLASDPGMLSQRLRLRTPEAFVARWKLLYFPGWTVKVDGQPVSATPEDDSGVLLSPIPAGEHSVSLSFEATPLRAWANGVSAIGLLAGACLVVGYRALSRGRRLDEPAEEPPARGIRWPALAGLLAVALLGLKLVWIDRSSTPAHRSRLATGELPEVAQPLGQRYGDGLRLLGFDISASSLPADGELQVDLLWQAEEIPTQEYRVSVLIVGSDGRTWSPAGTLRPRGYEPSPPTTMWQPGQYVYDPHIVTPLAGTPPGRYSVVVSIFSRFGLEPLSLLDASGAPLGPELRLGDVEIGLPGSLPTLEALGVPDGVSLRSCTGLGLWHAAINRQTAAPGELLTLSTVWEALAAPMTAEDLHLTLVDASGREMRSWLLPPVASWWPTERWKTGERWVGRASVRIPGSTESGSYHFSLQLSGCELPLATLPLAVLAPERVWEVPPDITPVDVVFGDQVRLAGFSLEPAGSVLRPGETFTVRLVWQAVKEMETSHRVYLHLLDSTGRVVAQRDGEPAAWTRPTTGWAVGEVVVEERPLTVPESAPAGTYRVRVGLYQLDGPRLLAANGDDGVTLAPLEVP